MPQPGWQQALDQVGPRLRLLRQRRGLTLVQVAEQTQISVSTLSRLESGARKPTLELLLPIAEVYRVPLDHLVDAPSSGDPRIHPRPVQRADLVYIPLSRRGSDLQAYKLLLPGRDVAGDPRPRTHEGTEWLYVLDGTLRLRVGERVTELGRGEAAEFDCHVPHAICSADDQPVELLALFSPQGARLHIEAE